MKARPRRRSSESWHVHFRFPGKNAFLGRITRRAKGRRVETRAIVHPGAALIVPYLTDETMLLLRQYRPAIDRFLYEFPAGTVDPGETPLRCAKRECQEETGYRAARFKRIGVLYPVPGYSTERMVVYEARGLHRDPRPGDPDEVIEVRRVGKAALRRMFAAGRICDAKTICAMALGGLL